MRLMLDDLRAPPSKQWDVARSYDAAVWYFENVGTPAYLSLDHDLGDDCPTGYDFTKWIMNAALDGEITLDNLREVHIHSANPIGAQNMVRLLVNLFNFLQTDGKMVNIPTITADLYHAITQ